MPTRTDDGLITLTSDEVHDFALETLLKGVHLNINGKKCTLKNVFELVLKASAGQTSVNDVCDDTPGSPTGTAVLNQLHQALRAVQFSVMSPRVAKPARSHTSNTEILRILRALRMT